jgi:hypothetical protein
MPLISKKIVCLVLFFCALLVIGEAKAATWRAGDITDWEFAGDNLWNQLEGTLVQSSPGDTSAGLADYWAGPKGAQADGDFTLTARAGFNPEGYPLGENGKISWRIYYRTIALGVMADSANGIFAVFCRSNGDRNGIVRLVDGKNIWLANPTGGQGVGLDIHDTREYKMSRRGRLITVWLDDVPVFQAEDTLGVIAGRPVVCGPGPVGILLEGMSLVHRAAEAPKVEMAAAVDSFIVGMENGSGPLLRDIYGKPLGTVELGDSLFGWWTTGYNPGQNYHDIKDLGGKSWVAAGGQLNIPNFRMAPEETIECWFRLVKVPPKGGVPILHFGFDGTRMDSTWLERERGGPMAQVFPDSSLGLHFHEFGDSNADLPGIFTLGKWTHLAWVRKGAMHRIYVDRVEVLSMHLPKYGERPLTGLQLNVAQNADHDWLLEPGKPYLELNSMCAVPRALEPGQFMTHGFPRTLQDERGVPYLFSIGSCSRTTNPLHGMAIEPVNIPEGYEDDIRYDLLDIDGNLVGNSKSTEMVPGAYKFNWYTELIVEKKLRSGVYFLRVRAERETRVKNIVWLSANPSQTLPPQSVATAKEKPAKQAPAKKTGCELSLEIFNSTLGYDAMVEVAEGCEGLYRLAVIRGSSTAKLVFSGELKSGTHRFHWDGTAADGNQILNGAYDMVLSGQGREIRRNIIFLK